MAVAWQSQAYSHVLAAEVDFLYACGWTSFVTDTGSVLWSSSGGRFFRVTQETAINFEKLGRKPSSGVRVEKESPTKAGNVKDFPEWMRIFVSAIPDEALYDLLVRLSRSPKLDEINDQLRTVAVMELGNRNEAFICDCCGSPIALSVTWQAGKTQ